MAQTPHRFFAFFCLRQDRSLHGPPWLEPFLHSLLSSTPPRLGALLFCVLLARAAEPIAAHAQEPPYYVTYSEVLEEPGNLEIAQKGTTGAPRDSNGFYSATLELEYGAKAWWTTELYLQGQATANDSTVFNGFRWENRFRMLPTEHWINPVLYVEYEDVNGADKSVLEVTGHDSIADFQGRNADTRGDVSRTMEGKLILSSNPKGWNVSENWIMEKNTMGGAWEFGYAVGASRPLALVASGRSCTFCRQNFSAGAEVYGGLATVHDFRCNDTSHYAGPTVQFDAPRGPSLLFSPQFGLSGNSAGVLWRLKISYEIQQFRDLFLHKEAQ
ncbi:MAG: hypothetical protein ABSC62_01235 [Terracidiphilus sp.]|jgi:hypothetical protein